MHEAKPNYALLDKQFDCDYRTVKRYYEAGLNNELPTLLNRKKTVSIISEFEGIISDKLALGCTAASIHSYISKKRYRDSYPTVRRYCPRYVGRSRKSRLHFTEISGKISAITTSFFYYIG